MAIIVTILPDGTISARADDATDAAAFVRELKGMNVITSAAPINGRTRRVTSAPNAPRDNIALDFLIAIEAKGKEGATAEDLMPVLKVEHPKGMGGRLARVNSDIKKLGFDPKKVYFNPKTPDGRLFSAGPHFNKVLELLKLF